MLNLRVLYSTLYGSARLDAVNEMYANLADKEQRPEVSRLQNEFQGGVAEQQARSNIEARNRVEEREGFIEGRSIASFDARVDRTGGGPFSIGDEKGTDRTIPAGFTELGTRIAELDFENMGPLQKNRAIAEMEAFDRARRNSLLRNEAISEQLSSERTEALVDERERLGVFAEAAKNTGIDLDKFTPGVLGSHNRAVKTMFAYAGDDISIDLVPVELERELIEMLQAKHRRIALEANDKAWRAGTTEERNPTHSYCGNRTQTGDSV